MNLEIKLDLDVIGEGNRAGLVETILDLANNIMQSAQLTPGQSGKLFAPNGNEAGRWRVTQ